MGTLGKLELYQPETVETISARMNVYPDVVRSLESQELSLPGAPSNGYRGEMPSDITALDDERLGVLLANLSSWCGYVEGRLAEAKVLMDCAVAERDKVKARKRLRLKADMNGKKLTNPERDDICDVDPEIVELESKALYAEAKYSMTEVILNNAQRNWSTTSRRITQMGQKNDRMNRLENTAATPVGNPGRFRRPHQ